MIKKFKLSHDKLIYKNKLIIILMEKYTKLETIGDGTYGSVIKGINTSNSTFFLISEFVYLRWICSNKKDEKKIHKMGRMC